MNEQLTNHEVSPEKFETKEHESNQPERSPESAKQHETEPNVVELQQNAAEKAVSAKEFTVGETRTDSGQQSPMLVQKELRTDAYARTIRRARRHLNPVDRAVSKIIHQPIIDSVSEFGSKTIARPSGILGGGLCALVGSGALLYASKHYGFTYNFSVFLILLVGGFLSGIILEFVLRLVKH